MRQIPLSKTNCDGIYDGNRKHYSIKSRDISYIHSNSSIFPMREARTCVAAAANAK